MYYQTKKDCPFCNKNFETTKILPSKVKSIKQDADFCQHYEENYNPVFYEIMVCPHCGYAFNKSSKKLFEPYLSLVREGYINKIEKPFQICGERTIEEAIASFKLAYLIAIEVRETKAFLGNIALKIAWLYRYKGDATKEGTFLKKAANYFEESLNSEKRNTAKTEDEDKMIYLIAELNLRTENYSLARKWFSYLITNKQVTQKYKKYALDRWQEYKLEEMEKEEESVSP